jgi:hypothetical protein
MGGKIQSHWGGNVEDESYNPYMPGSGITSIINGASHQNGGVGISYGGESQNGYEQMAANGANMGAQIEAEDGESMIEMANGGEIDPQTGEQETNAVVIGNIPAKYDVLSLISDNQDLLGYLKKKGNDGRTMKSLFAQLTKEEIAATKAKEKASKIANNADNTTIGKLDLQTAKIIEDAGDANLQAIANTKIGFAESQDVLHKIKSKISKSLGYNISAEDLGRGKITKDRDPITKDAPIENAKSGAYLRKAQTGFVEGLGVDSEGYNPYAYTASNIVANNKPLRTFSIGDYGNEWERSMYPQGVALDTYRGDPNVMPYKEAFIPDDYTMIDQTPNLSGGYLQTYGDGDTWNYTVNGNERKIDRSSGSSDTEYRDSEDPNFWWSSKKDAEDANNKNKSVGKNKQAATTTPSNTTSAPTTTSQEPALTEAEYNEFIKQYEESKSTGNKKNPVNIKFQRAYHKKFPKESLTAIQKTTAEKGLSNKAKQMGLTKEDIASGKDLDRILQSNEDEYYGPITEQYKTNITSAYNNRPAAAPFQLNTLGAAPATEQTATDKKGIDVVPLKRNSALDAMGMISQLFQNRKFPSIDPRQFAGENVASSLNVQQPVPMQKPSVELDPIYRMNYNDVRNANTAGLRDVLRQNQGNPAANALALGRFAQQNQSIGGEEFRTNQDIEQQIYGGNRAKVNQNQNIALALNADQANKQSVAKSKTDERNIEIAKSRSDKEMKYTADKNKFLTASNLFPKYGYNANYQTQMQGPGYNPVIPQIYGGKASIQQVPVYKNGVLDHYEMIEGDGTTTNTTTLAPYQTPPFVATGKNGGKVKKNYKNSSVVRAYKNL